MLRAVIFDLDGTFYDSRPLHWLLPIAELPYLRYLQRERSLRRQMRGCPHDSEASFYHHLFRSISPRHPERAEAWYHRHYLPQQVGIIRRWCHADAWVLPRVHELRSQGIKVAVYSDYGSARQKLQALHIDPALFDVVADAPSLGGLKPCEQSSRRLFALLGVHPQEAMFVGDRIDTDIDAARLVGARYQLVQRHGGQVTFTTDIPQDYVTPQ